MLQPRNRHDLLRKTETAAPVERRAGHGAHHQAADAKTVSPQAKNPVGRRAEGCERERRQIAARPRNAGAASPLVNGGNGICLNTRHDGKGAGRRASPRARSSVTTAIATRRSLAG
ncbi:hypothetical protein C6558_08800 [Ensifer sp. NM-2]|nr:hypothetical protein C6558_08800 [Ensifer sp. NM-2]